MDVAGHRLELELIGGTQEGAAPLLVFLHEGLGCASAWRELPAALSAATGCPALIYSRRGYGRSEPLPAPWPTSFMQEEALRVLPALIAAVGDPHELILIGHSDGASIALLYAAAFPARVRGLILEAPHVFVEEVCVRAIAALKAAYPDSELRQRLARRHDDPEGLFAAWTGVWLSPAFRLWNIEHELAAVRARTLVIQGDADEYGTLAQVDAVCSGITGPAERMILPGVGHTPHRDRPHEVQDAMLRFIRQTRDSLRMPDGE